MRVSVEKIDYDDTSLESIRETLEEILNNHGKLPTFISYQLIPVDTSYSVSDSDNWMRSYTYRERGLLIVTQWSD